MIMVENSVYRIYIQGSHGHEIPGNILKFEKRFSRPGKVWEFIKRAKNAKVVAREVCVNDKMHTYYVCIKCLYNV